MNTNTRSNSSRERILACAEAVILQKGFSGTSIEDILEKASITKGGKFGWKAAMGMPPKGMGATDAEIKAMAKYIAGLAR